MSNEVSTETKRRVHELRDKGWSVTEIERELSVSGSTIYKILTRHRPAILLGRTDHNHLAVLLNHLSEELVSANRTEQDVEKILIKVIQLGMAAISKVHGTAHVKVVLYDLIKRLK